MMVTVKVKVMVKVKVKVMVTVTVKVTVKLMTKVTGYQTLARELSAAVGGAKRLLKIYA